MRRAEHKEAQALICFLEALKIAFGACLYANALNALAGIATVRANGGLNTLAQEIVLHIQQNPAATHQAKASAEQLGAELEARLMQQQIEAAQADAQAQSFEAIVKCYPRAIQRRCESPGQWKDNEPGF